MSYSFLFLLVLCVLMKGYQRTTNKMAERDGGVDGLLWELESMWENAGFLMHGGLLLRYADAIRQQDPLLRACARQKQTWEKEKAAVAEIFEHYLGLPADHLKWVIEGAIKECGKLDKSSELWKTLWIHFERRSDRAIKQRCVAKLKELGFDDKLWRNNDIVWDQYGNANDLLKVQLARIRALRIVEEFVRR
jgi:hypothetical protein